MKLFMDSNHLKYSRNSNDSFVLACFSILQEVAKEAKQEEASKKEEPKFQAFTGKKYSLKG